MSTARKARIDAWLLLRGQTTEQAMEPWLSDIERQMGHDPADTQADQDATLAKAQRRAAKAEADRTTPAEATP